MDTTYFKFEDLVNGNSHIPKQLSILYRAAAEREKPTIVELGTQKGRSTTCFLTACEERDGRLVSLDINDCSDVSQSPRWTFVQADAADVATATRHAPFLTQGIDLLYIDAGHSWARVKKELEAWFPLVKDGGLIYFDDVDPLPYRVGGPKDSPTIERNLNEIAAYLREFFISNQDDLEFSITYGSTGLGRLVKHLPLGAVPKLAAPIPGRPLHIKARTELAKLRRKWITASSHAS